MPETREIRTRVGDRELSLSNLDKVLYPSVGFTKAEVIDYYASIAPVMLPHVSDRAMTRLRYPDGVPIGAPSGATAAARHPDRLVLREERADRHARLGYAA